MTCRKPFAAVFALALFAFSLGSGHAITDVAYQMLLGNPSGATADTNNHAHYLIQRDVQALDYSDIYRQPNWASWHYTSGDSGSVARTDAYAADTNLPPNFYRVKATDFSGSGYDRGHMCPSADRTDTVQNNIDTFLMSNMIPQAPDSNQGVWNNLESFSRTLAASGSEVLVTCGTEGFGTNVTASAGQIPIASNVWKIIVVVPAGPGSTLSRITATNRVIAVNIPNIQGVRTTPWTNFLTTVNALQSSTGYNFFTALDPSIATVLRAKRDGAPATGITSFAPNTGPAGTAIVISGTNFTGATTVQFNGAPAVFTLNSPTTITATVPTNASTGPISMIAAGGLATSASTFTASVVATNPPALPPTLTDFGFSNQQFYFTVTGTAGSNYIVQVATSVATGDWSAVATNTAPFTYIDTNTATFTTRCYRALVRP